MAPVDPDDPTRLADLDDAALVARAQQRVGAAFWLIMKRHNQRLYRVARGVLGDDPEAEDVVQETYMHAFAHLSEFRGEARLSSWLTRIALNQALRRLRQRRPTVELQTIEAIDNPALSAISTALSAQAADPETAAALGEIRRLLEKAVDALPAHLRIIFVMRDVEGMSTEETGLHLGLKPGTVRTRLHRARRLLRKALQDKLAAVFTDIFPFAADRCDRFTQSILERLGISLVRTQSHQLQRAVHRTWS